LEVIHEPVDDRFDHLLLVFLTAEQLVGSLYPVNECDGMTPGR
jgi:hypothetical protein